ncbi:hypothetical protein [Actinomadura barringtoniae]|uniref:hypothetical protein n=1 Tax=Actinomadura barringtoniae TaxID=1427535 RepID=UPI001FB59BFF|nr:hypothetical protein [Actinomadura barringtoniae]
MSTGTSPSSFALAATAAGVAAASFAGGVGDADALGEAEAFPLPDALGLGPGAVGGAVRVAAPAARALVACSL